MLQWRINWSVPNAGPSVSVLHTQGQTSVEVGAAQPVLQTFIASLAGALMPDNVNLQLDAEVRVINETTGALQAVHSIVPAPADSGSSVAVWVAGSGARIDWHTGVIVAGRQLRGRTFIVPLTQTAFDTNGVVAPAAIGTLQGAAATLWTNLASAGSPLQVWHRPVNGAGGVAHDVNGAVVPPLAATLRERKY